MGNYILYFEKLNQKKKGASYLGGKTAEGKEGRCPLLPNLCFPVRPLINEELVKRRLSKEASLKEGLGRSVLYPCSQEEECLKGVSSRGNWWAPLIFH